MSEEKETKTLEFTHHAPKGRSTWMQKNLSHGPREIVYLSLKGEGLLLFLVQVGVAESLETTDGRVELFLSPLWWHPFIELFLEMESPKVQEVTIRVEFKEHPGESGFESPLD